MCGRTLTALRAAGFRLWATCGQAIGQPVRLARSVWEYYRITRGVSLDLVTDAVTSFRPFALSYVARPFAPLVAARCGSLLRFSDLLILFQCPTVPSASPSPLPSVDPVTPIVHALLPRRVYSHSESSWFFFCLFHFPFFLCFFFIHFSLYTLESRKRGINEKQISSLFESQPAACRTCNFCAFGIGAQLSDGMPKRSFASLFSGSV